MSFGGVTKKKLISLMGEPDFSKLQEFGGIDGLMNSLRSGPHGITEANLLTEERIHRFGTNEMAKPKSKSFLRQWLEAFQDTTLIILIVLAVISLIIAGAVEHFEDLSWLDGTAILGTVLIVTLVTAWNNWSQERQFQKLNERQSDHPILVMRDGQPTKISILKLMVGDIYMIQTGDVLPADGLCIESHNIQCDEAAMTGESDLIKKSPERQPFMLSGCKVQTGFGKMLVVCVGMNTRFGILKQAVLTAAEERTQTPLQEKLDKLASRIGYVGMAAAGAVLVLLIIFWIVEGAKDSDLWTTGAFYIKLVNYFTIAVSIVVMAVPEGLPLAVTIALAYSMGRMLKDKNLVRILSACETMGGATSICSDKTGTLTQNKMRVTNGFFQGRLMDIEQRRLPGQKKKGEEGAASSSEGEGAQEMENMTKNKSQFDDKYTKLMADACALCSSANIRINEKGLIDYLGNVTECALLRFCNEQGAEHYETIREKAKTVQTYPFSSEKKQMSVVVDKGDSWRIYTKGASEVVSGMCSKMIIFNNMVQNIDKTMRKRIDENINQMAADALRTLAIAYRDIPKNKMDKLDPRFLPKTDAEGPFGEEPPTQQMTLIFIAGIRDPLRQEVPAAIQDCHDGGIVVRMVTGDNIVTAMNIAKGCGIYDPKEGIAMEGPLFRNLTDQDRLKILPRLQVLARSSPIDKLTLVGGLQELGHVVAVTGDGTNDAPALSKSDVGFAMGITGTEVAKDASDIIITDDNFASIVKAVMWGRNVYDCIRKFIQFQLTVNVSAISIAVFAAIFAITPLTAVQMLWVNLIMDTLAALALATERPTRILLKRKPYGRKDGIISKSMWRNIIGGSIYEFIVVVISLFLWGDSDDGYAGKHPTKRMFYCFFDLEFKKGWEKVDSDGVLHHLDEISAEKADDFISHYNAVPIDASALIFPNGICRHYLLDRDVAVFSKEHFSFIFNTFIFMQMFNWITARKCYNEINFFDRLHRNWMFLLIWFIVLVFQIILMFVPGIRDAFNVPGLMSAQLWGFSLLFSVLIIPVKFLLHLLIKMPDPFNGDIPIEPVPGVPAGVYRYKQPYPEGCTLHPPNYDEEPTVPAPGTAKAAPSSSSSSSSSADDDIPPPSDETPPPPPDEDL